MKKLLKIYGFENPNEYFEMIAQSFVVGQQAQGFIQFKSMPREFRKNMIKLLFAKDIQGIQYGTVMQLIDLI